MEPTLSQRLVTSIRGVHQNAHTLVMRKAVAVLTEPRVYAHALSCFWFVFVELEDQLQAALIKAEPGTHIHETLTLLLRCAKRPGLEADLRYFLGDDWEQKVSPTVAVKRLVSHLKALGKKGPEYILAHAFHQYLASMAGGQVVKRLVSKQLELPGDVGTQFYVIPERCTAPDIKTAFNNLESGLSEETCEAMLAEGANVFKMNNQIISQFSVFWSSYIRSAVMLCTMMPWQYKAATVGAIGACIVGVYFARAGSSTTRDANA